MRGGSFWGAENFPSLVFYILVQGLLAQASLACPSELTYHFSFGAIMSMALYGPAFAYSNPLQVD